jgi:hypothetical protein
MFLSNTENRHENSPETQSTQLTLHVQTQLQAQCEIKGGMAALAPLLC